MVTPLSRARQREWTRAAATTHSLCTVCAAPPDSLHAIHGVAVSTEPEEPTTITQLYMRPLWQGQGGPSRPSCWALYATMAYNENTMAGALAASWQRQGGPSGLSHGAHKAIFSTNTQQHGLLPRPGRAHTAS
eukprot:365469-Chlamydomonas_euryale.AAC.26